MEPEDQALVRDLQHTASQLLELLPTPGEELHAQIAGESDPRQLAYLVASTLLFRSTMPPSARRYWNCRRYAKS